MAESYCVTCAKGVLGCTTCCVSPFVEKDPGFWMTLSDVARIVNKTKLDPDEFCRWTTVDDDELEEDDDLDDRHADLMEYNDKIILMNGTGKCFFLGSEGCTIFKDRPKMCRIYPFWFKENKKGEVKITVQKEEKIEEDDCLITKSNYGNKDIQFLLSRMNEKEENMKEVVKKYIKEMELHAKYKKLLEKMTILDVLKEAGLVDKDIKTKKIGQNEKNFYLPILNK